ncbi:MAG: aldo/keto reductase [Spirochaetaceae bacterium]|nr:aldo/keto reductase [Spirochaetaceae bacterium]
MKLNRLGSSGLTVSEIGLGCMSLAKAGDAADAIVHRALDLGVNFFDTADLYERGANEERLARALGRRRGEVIVATKVGNRWRAGGDGWDWDPSPAHIRRAVEASLRRLSTDYIDLYQLHGGTIEDPIDDVIATFEALREAGTIRAWGISSIRPNVIREYAARSSIASVMMQYSVLDRRPEEQALPLLRDRGISVIARGPVAKGLLAHSRGEYGKPARAQLGHDRERVAVIQQVLGEVSAAAGRTPAQSALRFALAAPAVATVIPGASSLAQLQDNVAAAASTPLGDGEAAALGAAAPAQRYAVHR